MILDHLDNWNGYFSLPAWREALEFTRGLGPDAAEGDYEIRGRDIWARVFSYATRPLPQGVLEAHRAYVDVQAVLAGEEVQARCPVHELEVQEAYDPARDVEFFVHPAAYPATWLARPGLFAAFFPQDAHLTQGQVMAMARVKKVVVKVNRALLLP